MVELRFDAPAGDEIWEVQLSVPSGIGGDSFFVMINGYYRGTIWKRNGTWCGNAQAELNFTMDDMQAMGERIEESGLWNIK